MKPSRWYQCEGVARSRRDFLRAGALTFLGLSLSEYLQLSAAPTFAKSALLSVKSKKAQSCILLWLEGGGESPGYLGCEGQLRTQAHLNQRPGNSDFRNIARTCPAYGQAVFHSLNDNE